MNRTERKNWKKPAHTNECDRKEKYFQSSLLYGHKNVFVCCKWEFKKTEENRYFMLKKQKRSKSKREKKKQSKRLLGRKKTFIEIGVIHCRFSQSIRIK